MSGVKIEDQTGKLPKTYEPDEGDIVKYPKSFSDGYNYLMFTDEGTWVNLENGAVIQELDTPPSLDMRVDCAKLIVA